MPPSNILIVWFVRRNPTALICIKTQSLLDLMNCDRKVTGVDHRGVM